ncbi:hypothetical protein [Tardiphaga sp. OK246]|uniref:hypothetical protein n=1 Tax=Tardiphaga sp. OK246 TaxID=1855307 RepID=UPI000B783136|nr:hypothetical protein [Tardiphaga sp. OK246]
MKQTLEVPYDALVRQRDQASIAIYREMFRDIEAARLCISPLKGGSLSARRQAGTNEKHLVELLEVLVGITGNPDYLPNLRSLRISKNADHSGGYDDTALMAIERLINRINIQLEVIGVPVASEALLRLKVLIPAQKIAPVQFEIRGNKVSIKETVSAPPANRRRIIKSARDELLQTGKEIIQELELSNCDRRLLDRMQHLNFQLTGRIDAVRIGLATLSCEMMCSALEQELPSAVFSMLNAYTRGVQLFVGQFPEWNNFLENAAATNFDSGDIYSLQRATSELVESLSHHSEYVDPEVPRTLAFLNELLANPVKATKKAAFAVLRSAENLISVIFGFGVEFAQKTASKTLDAASSTASKVIVATLLAIALSGATSIGPIAGRLPEMQWLKTAADIVKKELELYGKPR